jgi:hypothetical protein
MAEWTRAEYDAALAAVQDLGAKISELGVPAQHPFDGCGLVELMPGDLEKIEATLRAAIAAGKSVQDAIAALATATGVAAPRDISGAEALIAAAALALEAPDLKGLPPIGPAWDRAETVQAFTKACEQGMQRRAIVAKYASKLIAEAWDADVLQARADLMADGGSWWKRLFSGRYKAARRKVQGLCTLPAPTRMEELVVLTDRILEARRLRAALAENAAALQTLAGSRAAGADGAWEELQKIRDWALKFRALTVARRLPASLADWAVSGWDRKALAGLYAAASKAAAAWRSSAAQVRAALAIPAGGKHDSEPLAFPASEEKAESWRKNLPKLPTYVAT